MSIVHGFLDLVFAPRCLGCAGPSLRPASPASAGSAETTGTTERSGSDRPAPLLVCARCRSRLVPPPAPLCARCGFPRLRTGREPGPVCQECGDWPADLRTARSACLLREPASSLVHQLKYRGWHRLAEEMAGPMIRTGLPGDVRAEATLVVPVPTTELRRRERGYNQAELLARAIADGTGRTMIRALRRGLSGGAAASSQTTLQPAARRANVAGAFGPVAGTEHDIAGEHLLLVDDVLTTGATVTECAETLVEAGARCVSVLTFARAIGRLRLD